jgi:hypothetical protein
MCLSLMLSRKLLNRLLDLYTAAKVSSRGKSGNYVITPKINNVTLGGKVP